jgi:mediator of replication checkpoint protein 1
MGGNLLRKADEIFEKEQEYLIEAATKKGQEEPELYVNDQG